MATWSLYFPTAEKVHGWSVVATHILLESHETWTVDLIEIFDFEPSPIELS